MKTIEPIALKSHLISQKLDTSMTELLHVKIEMDALCEILQRAGDSDEADSHTFAGLGFIISGYVKRLEEVNLALDSAFQALAKKSRSPERTA